MPKNNLFEYLKPRIFKENGCWYLFIGKKWWICLTWKDAVETFNKIRFERLVSK